MPMGVQYGGQRSTSDAVPQMASSLLKSHVFIDLKFTGSVCLCCPSTRTANKEPSQQLTWVLRPELKSSWLLACAVLTGLPLKPSLSFESLLMI